MMTCTACTVPESFPKVTLRGLCPDSPYDRTYSIRVDQSGNPFLQGDSSSLIFYDTKLSTWVLWSRYTRNRVATSNHHQYSLIMGVVKFDFKNIPFGICGTRDGNTEHVLKLTTCTDNMFTCDDGGCIDVEERCDDKTDCFDGSDEKNCKKISMSKKYVKGVAPFTMDQDWKNKIPVGVKISLSVDNILR